LAVVWKVGAKQFKHFATFAKSFQVVESFSSAKQCLLYKIGVEVRKARVRECSVELLSFKKRKQSVMLNNLNLICYS
jgi:hypothetical protein